MAQQITSIDDLFARTSPDPNTGCWLWLGAVDRDGYGRHGQSGDRRRVPRLSWLLSRGTSAGEMLVLHTCDTPACCNPSHLFLGTNADNVADKVAKGRQASGDRHGSRTQPEQLQRGDEHYSRREPERLARGDANGARVHPEKMPKGQTHYKARLTTSQVATIRERLALGETQTNLGREYGVTTGCIWRIAHNLNRKAG